MTCHCALPIIFSLTAVIEFCFVSNNMLCKIDNLTRLLYETTDIYAVKHACEGF